MNIGDGWLITKITWWKKTLCSFERQSNKYDALQDPIKAISQFLCNL